MQSATIKSIDPSAPETWQHCIFITIDIDWAIDEVIHDTADLIESAGASATWFVTHESPALQRIRDNPCWEIGIHPNFNDLLEGNFRNGRNSREVIRRMMDIAPEAKSVRSHSLTQSSLIRSAFTEVGLTHECNDLIPAQSGLMLRPWWTPPGLIKVPHYWEDDVCFDMPAEPLVPELLRDPGLKVFDFHPIHICLNSSERADYEAVRPKLHDFEAICARRTVCNYGSRTALNAVLEALA